VTADGAGSGRPRLADVGAAAPNVALAALCVLTWLAPTSLGDRQVAFVLLLLLLEAIVIHSAAFMGQSVVDIDQPGARLVSLAGFAVFYTLFAAALSLAFHVWWPLPVFWLLTLNRLLGTFLGQAPAGDRRDLIMAGWGAGTLFLMAGIALGLVLDLPRLGLTAEVVAAQGIPERGIWTEAPQKLLVAGAIYYLLSGWSELYGYGWLRGRIRLPGRVPRSA
jgi:hypothetical protein